MADFSSISPIMGIFNEILSRKCAKGLDRVFAMINTVMKAMKPTAMTTMKAMQAMKAMAAMTP